MHGIPALTLVVSTVGALLHPVVGRLRSKRRRQSRRNTLSHVDDHLLRDIGLSRADVIARRILEE
ncbi:MAG: DUF1127 domain-containing protein [Aestuariivirgaceae bacterium]|jgi:uncharacterized protein YjiS (DUF1127 family)